MPKVTLSFKRERSGGFTLIELMIVVAIIGILASLAILAMQTYTVRAQITEGLNMADGAKVPIVDAYTNSGRAAADRSAAGTSPNAADTRGNYVSAVAAFPPRSARTVAPVDTTSTDRESARLPGDGEHRRLQPAARFLAQAVATCVQGE